MDYAVTYQQIHSIHEQLARVETGHCVSFCRKNVRIEIQNGKGTCLAILSKKGVDKWMDRLDQILEVRVLAMLQRNCDDPEGDFQERINAEKWELPVLEVISRGK
jgi:hypothetical protein